jgi:hypothetical protein
MAASEFAFLALGLVLGVASGIAVVVVLGSRPPAREVRLTVEHDAVPRRAATLSSDAFTAPGLPARGGPADRRRLDRDDPVADPPYMGPGVPVMGAAGGARAFAAGPLAALRGRTSVPSMPPSSGAQTTRAGLRWPGSPATMEARGIADTPMAPERDPSIDALRIQAVLVAERAQRAGLATAVALLEGRSEPEAMPTAIAAAAASGPATDPDQTPALIRILRGDHRALIAGVGILAGDDDAMRRPWQAGVIALVEAVIHRAIDRGVLDFPVGNPFWDTFTTEQCRDIAAGLAATGHRFDGIDGWADGRTPNHRDLTEAVAAAGLEPRRIRAWPTQEEIAALYREVTVAADEVLIDEAADLDLGAVRELAGARSSDLDILWRHWDLARSVLGSPIVTA